MIEETPIPEIDISGVPPHLGTHRVFLDLFCEVKEALMNPAQIRAVCIHEAGHHIYFSKMGVKNFLPTKARIWYDEEAKLFDSELAGLRPDLTSIRVNIQTVREQVLDMAKASAAGGIFTEALAEGMDVGNRRDRGLFKLQCEGLRPKVIVDDEAFWKLGEDEVRKDLKNEQEKENALTEARKIKLLIYPWSDVQF